MISTDDDDEDGDMMMIVHKLHSLALLKMVRYCSTNVIIGTCQ